VSIIQFRKKTEHGVIKFAVLNIRDLITRAYFGEGVFGVRLEKPNFGLFYSSL